MKTTMFATITLATLCVSTSTHAMLTRGRHGISKIASRTTAFIAQANGSSLVPYYAQDPKEDSKLVVEAIGSKVQKISELINKQYEKERKEVNRINSAGDGIGLGAIVYLKIDKQELAGINQTLIEIDDHVIKLGLHLSGIKDQLRDRIEVIERLAGKPIDYESHQKINEHLKKVVEDAKLMRQAISLLRNHRIEN